MPDDVTTSNIALFADPYSVALYSREQAFFPWEGRLVGEYFPRPPARVLDLGCGAGRVTIPLARLGYDLVGIDLSDALLDAGRRLAPAIDFRHMDASALDFPDASFDAAIFAYNGLDCVYPMASRERTLCEVRRVLRPGAPFLFSSNNFVGTLFSGGFFYLRGYLGALRWLARQIGNPLIRERYLRYPDPAGDHQLYYGSPDLTLAQLRAAGFANPVVRGRYGNDNPRWIAWREMYPHYVAWAPGAPIIPAR